MIHLDQMGIAVVGEDILGTVATSCSDAFARQDDVQIEERTLRVLAQELASLVPEAEYVKLPIVFDSLNEEVSYLFLLHLLDFGSGFDSLLKDKIQRDAHEVVLYGMLGLAMQGSRLDTRSLQAFSSYQVYSFFGIDASEDQEVMPGITISRQGPLKPYVAAIRDVLNQTGEALAKLGHADPGAFVLASLDRAAAAGARPSAAALVADVASAFPGGFDDRLPLAAGSPLGTTPGMLGGGQGPDTPCATFARKAQALAAQLALRFGGADARFAFGDLGRLAADSGAVMPAVLRQAGVLRYSAALGLAVDGGADLAGTPQELAIRAATVVAARALSDVGGGRVPPFQIGLHLIDRARRGSGGAAAPARHHVAVGVLSY